MKKASLFMLLLSLAACVGDGSAPFGPEVFTVSERYTGPQGLDEAQQIATTEATDDCAAKKEKMLKLGSSTATDNIMAYSITFKCIDPDSAE